MAGLIGLGLVRTEPDLLAAETRPSSARELVPKAIVMRRDASALEALAANEVRRYTYLRTGKVLPVKRGPSALGCVVVSCKDKAMCGELGQGLAPQEFLLKSRTADGQHAWWVVGGDEVGTLYGAYRLAEKLGVRFGLEADALPDQPMNGGWPDLDETGKPRFALRGLQPFHDFSTGPDWWNAQDYRGVLAQMAKLRLNFIGLHTYPSWNPAAGPEANVWIGLPEDVDAQGNVRFGYEAGVVTTRRGWQVKALPTNRYAAGGGLLFEGDDYGPDFMLDCLDWPKTEESSAAMFNRYGDLQQQVFSQARRLGIKTCVGTELPLGVPKALASRLEAKGMKPNDPAVIRRLYEGTFLRLKRKLPLDYYWLWTPEIWLAREPGCAGWEMTSSSNVERDLGLAGAAAKSVQAPFGFASCGWRLGVREDSLWMDKRTPTNWVASSINTQLGRDPVAKAYGAMTHRPRWAIAWAEDDDTAGAHCCTCWDLQLWVKRLMVHTGEALGYGCEGMMAIHWRTAAISPNIMALSRAGWELEGTSGNNARADTVDAKMPEVEAYWADWGRGMFGGDTGAGIGRTIQKLDGSHLGINALVRGGAQTTDEQIEQFFAPLRELESFQARPKGAGARERFDYWLNLIRATRLRVRVWVLADRLGVKMKAVNAIQGSDRKQDFLRKEVLPLRLEIARGYEELMAAFVNCARSPGEIGTIASIESGSRDRIVSPHDRAMEALLGEPLPAEVAVSTAYRGAPRIFVSGHCTLRNAGEPWEIRAFVLSASKCAGVNLYWRPLGEGGFRMVAAGHRARQAYRVILPAPRQAIVEYYLGALLDDGQEVHWPATAPFVGQTVVAW